MKKQVFMHRRTNVYLTVMLSSLLPCVLATLLLAMVFFPLMSQSAKKNDEAYEDNLLYATAGKFSDLFTSFDNAVAVVENSNWIHPIFLDAIIEKDIDSALRKTVQKELTVTCARNSFQQFSFMFYDMPTLYADSGVKYNQQTYLESEDILDNNFFHSDSLEPTVSTLSYKGEEYLLYQSPFRVVSAGSYRGEVNILVRSVSLGKRLENAIGEDAVAFRLTDSEGDTLWAYTTSEYVGGTVLLSQPSSDGRFCFCVEIPMAIHRQTREETVSIMVGTLVCSLGVSLILCLILSRGTYRPIQRLLNKFIVAEDTPNFEMLEQVFDSIIQEKVVMESSLEQLRPIAHQKMLGAMLDGSAFLGDSEDQMENCGIRFAYEQFNVIALEAPFSQLKDTPAAELAAEILSEALSSQLPLKAYLYYENSDQYRIVLNYDSWDDLQAYLSLLTSNIKQYFWNQDVPSGVYVGVGQAVSAPEELYRSAEQADTAVYMAILNRLDQPMFYREMAPELNYEYFYPMSEELLLSRAVTNGNLASAKSVLYSVLEENRKNAGLNPKCLQFLYMDLSSTVARSGQSLGVRTLSLDSREGYISLDEIGSRVEQMIDHICGQIMEKRSKSVTPTEQKVLDYIDSHLFDPNLSLNSVGEAFQISPGYVSNIFRAHRDTNFNNYVNQMRIMRAIQIMTEEGLDSASVYPQVGYTNLTTFRRNFIKFAKHSPGQTLSVDGENDEE